MRQIFHAGLNAKIGFAQGLREYVNEQENHFGNRAVISLAFAISFLVSPKADAPLRITDTDEAAVKDCTRKKNPYFGTSNLCNYAYSAREPMRQRTNNYNYTPQKPCRFYVSALNSYNYTPGNSYN